MKCPKCKGKIIKQIGMGQLTTLVGYCSPPGHNHDDNCIKRLYLCENGHKIILSKRRRCHCGWVGKESCFCHDGLKIDEWLDVIFEKTNDF